MKRSLRPAPFLALCFALSSPAAAQQTDSQRTAAAQELYDRAYAEMQAKNFAAACPKLQEAVRLVPEGIGAKLTLAECYEGAGKLASAWSMYTLAQSAAERSKQADRAAKAEKRAAALRPKLAELTIVVPDDVRSVSGLEIVRDDVPVGPSQWELPLPIDKGAHVVRVKAGDRTWTKQVDIPEDGVKITVVVEAPRDLALPVRDETKPKKATATDAPPAAGGTWQRPVGITLGAVGLVGVGVGTAFGLIAKNKLDESNDGPCDSDDRCTREGLDLREQALTASTVSTIAFVAGGVALTAGVVLFLSAPATPERAASGAAAHRTRPSAALFFGPAQAGVVGSF